ncbi:short-chain dehydrogenase [Flavipsychrobacter stenotrophus]|uniref:Short-chain dehydrogenase n=1 Tax=Flavipsychrobacter stenotrophus TaxID=2077091 RepID=A0A2S7T2U7_9BACT|nr:SDR family NAD(P)-dependent oxidoreductase [Flavipsychrobacter stenotrophus]PQJ13177.1 short-chain dehydrogenase [Flavipsychrobacter stenotrophus]
MKKALITGANRSIGFEAARQLLKKGYYVYLGSRTLANGQEAVDKLKAEGLTEVEAIALDVTNDESVKNARTELGTKTNVLDVLINNAGISGGFPQTAQTSSIDTFKEVFDTNLYGVVRTTQAFMDLLQQSAEPRIVNVTSGLGSLTMHTDTSWKYFAVKGAIYAPSKAALNMYTITLAYELRDTPFKVNAVDPGYTATEFNHFRGTGTVHDAAARLVKGATLAPDGPTGTFFSDDNNPETGISLW